MVILLGKYTGAFTSEILFYYIYILFLERMYWSTYLRECECERQEAMRAATPYIVSS
jgi:hypothetical protein